MIYILSNSLKFTENEGRASITAKLADVGAKVFMFSYTGIGNPVVSLKTALERSRQIRDSFLISHEGTGLGLPLVKRMIDLHNGSLKLESEVGVGTSGIIKFPQELTILDM